MKPQIKIKHYTDDKPKIEVKTYKMKNGIYFIEIETPLAYFFVKNFDNTLTFSKMIDSYNQIACFSVWFNFGKGTILIQAKENITKAVFIAEYLFNLETAEIIFNFCGS